MTRTYIKFEIVLIKKTIVWYSQNIESCLSKQHTHILYVLKILTFLVQFHQRPRLYNFPGGVKLLLGGYYVIIFIISGRLLLFSTYYVVNVPISIVLYTSIILSMTSLLTHTVAHSTRLSFRPKTTNQLLKKFLSLAIS